MRIGAYEVVAKLGEGGMGEVYRARDTKLDREVALKVLPDEFASDPERLARFEREAKTLASLNHPHIAQIYGFEQVDGPAKAGPHSSGDVASGFSRISALVMELVEGEDLSQRLARGAVPVDEALPIARQIAEALEVAHDAGIIHRDLKPANVKVRPDGTVKVLDFGLAKAVARSEGDGFSHRRPAEAEASALQTITTPAMTLHGMILGTAAYMAPEQAKGKVVDRRADIWAFGCVLYEMLTGQRTFAGEDVSDTLVSVLRDDPRWAALPPDTPAHVRALLRRCLQKDPQKRLPHIGSARLELAEGGAAEPAVAAPPTRGRVWMAAAAVGIVLSATAVGLLLLVNRPAAEPAPSQAAVRFAIEPPSGFSFPGANQVPRFAVSPDGTMVAYQMQDRDGSQMWLRALDSLDEQRIPGTAGPAAGNATQGPFWSPDGRYLAYFDEDAGQLRKVDRQNGAVQTVAAIPGNQLSGSWNDAGVVLMSSLGTKGVQRVPASGGAPVQVTSLDSANGEVSHLWPDFLPDGKHFIYHVSYVDGSDSAVFVASIDGGTPKRVVHSPASARVAWPNRLLFVRDDALVAQPFDLDRLELAGDSTVIATGLPVTPAGRLGVSVSRSGVLVHAVGATGEEPNETVWVNRANRDGEPTPPTVKVGFSGVRLSPDGNRLIYGRSAGVRNGRAINEMWIQDVTRGIESRVSNELVMAGLPPVFSPDGAGVLFTRPGTPVVLLNQDISGAAPAKPILTMAAGAVGVPLDVSREGIVLIAENEGTQYRGTFTAISALRPGAKTPAPFVAGLAGISGAAFSPDGRWVAYSAGPLAERQVFMQPFPDASAGKWPVSGAGGAYPRWRADGRELYFVDVDRRLMAVDVTLSPRVEIGVPKSLGLEVFTTRLAYPYDVSSDGRRFVVLRELSQAPGQVKLIVTVDWQRPAAPRK